MVFNGWSRSIVPSGDWIVTGRKTYSCFQRSFRPYLYTVYTYSDGKRGLIGSPGSESSPGVQSARRRWSDVQMKPMLERLVEEGTIANYADAARQLGVSRARITQILNLLNLPPRVQEGLLLGDLHLSERRIRALGAGDSATGLRRLCSFPAL